MAPRSSRSTSQNLQYQHGFTLVEVLLVLVVLSVLLGLAWPSLDRMFARNAMPFQNISVLLLNVR